MTKKIAFYHTTYNTPKPMKAAFEARFPGVPLISVTDDGVLPEIGEHGGYTPGIVRELIAFGHQAEERGAVAAVCMCTTLAGAVKKAAQAVDIPFLTIDGPMLTQAVTSGKRVALLITAKTTYVSSSEAARAAAQAAGATDVQIDTILVDGAFEALNAAHDKPLHDRLIAESARRAAADHDVIALAQVSMVDAAPLLTDLNVPVLTSVHSGIEQLAKYLKD